MFQAGIFKADGSAATSEAEAQQVAGGWGMHVVATEDASMGIFMVEISERAEAQLNRDGVLDLADGRGRVLIEEA